MGDESKQNETVQTTSSLYFQEENHLTLYCPLCGKPSVVNVSDFLEIPKEEVKGADMEICCPTPDCNTPWKLSLEVLLNLYESHQKLRSQCSEEEHSQKSQTQFFIIAITPP